MLILLIKLKYATFNLKFNMLLIRQNVKEWQKTKLGII